MDLPLSRSVVGTLIELPSVGSTNSELLARAADPALPEFATLVTTDQTDGRGRLDRTWVAPAGTSLAVSVLLRGRLNHPLASWIPLLAGRAMADAVAAAGGGDRVAVKWPNDVLIDGRKACGILAEAVPGTADVVLGAGLNLSQTTDELPRPDATSLALAGIPAGSRIDDLLARYLQGIWAPFDRGDDVATVRDVVAAACSTIGQRVRVDLGAEILVGTAVGLDLAGRLEVRADGGRITAVAAGDVVHVRPADA